MHACYVVVVNAADVLHRIHSYYCFVSIEVNSSFHIKSTLHFFLLYLLEKEQKEKQTRKERNCTEIDLSALSVITVRVGEGGRV